MASETSNRVSIDLAAFVRELLDELRNYQLVTNSKEDAMGQTRTTYRIEQRTPKNG